MVKAKARNQNYFRSFYIHIKNNVTVVAKRKNLKKFFNVHTRKNDKLYFSILEIAN